MSESLLTKNVVETVDDLEAIYGAAAPASLRKVADRMTPEYRKWIASSSFCVLATVGPEGADASPRGDRGEVVFELDDKTLAMPDWRGNNRTDSLRNIVRDGRVALMFLTPGSGTVIRINGRGAVSVDPELIARFEAGGKAPKTVVLFEIEELYFQCAKSVLRSGLWDQERWPDLSVLPTMGDILASMTDGEVGGAKYDMEWPDRAQKTLW